MEAKRILIVDPMRPPIPTGGGRWEQQGNELVQVELPTGEPVKPENPKAERITIANLTIKLTEPNEVQE